jgi:hypothetical protein
VPLHDLKIGVWSAISVQRKIQLLSFHEIINSKCYEKLILSLFFGQLIDGENLYGNFMQDNATAHMVNNSVIALDKVFGKRVTS